MGTPGRAHLRGLAGMANRPRAGRGAREGAVARALGKFPAIDQVMASGRLSYAKVRALTRVATPTNEAKLVEIALVATGAQLERLCRRCRRLIDDGAIPGIEPAPDPSCDARGVRVRTTDAGHMRIEVTLDPCDAALVLAAIDRVRDELRAVTGSTTGVSAETPSCASARVPVPGRLDALIAIAERTLAPAPETAADGTDRQVHQVVVHLDQAVLGPDETRETYLDDGTRVSAEIFRRVSCDSALVAIATGEAGQVLDVGRRTRVVPAAIRRALWSRDRGCRFPLCSNRRFVDAHHIQHWAHGGHTSLDNLVLLCGFHHRLLHESGFKMSWTAGDIGPRFYFPNGRELAAVPEHPNAASVPDLPRIEDPGVNLPHWDGEPVDYDEAVDAICAASG
jgi:hypothetical protein